MELTVIERLVLANLLPDEGNFITLRRVRKLREELSFSEEEHQALKFQQLGDKVQWDNTEAEKIVKDFDIGETLMDEIKAKFKKMDEDKKLKDEHITLYEKFIGE